MVSGIQNGKTCSVVYNPVATKFSENVLEHLLSAIKDGGWTLKECVRSEYSGHVIPLIKELDPVNDLIVTLGGDGTANEAVKAFNSIDQHCFYSHISAGTTNDMAENFGLDRKDPIKSVDILASSWQEKTIDSIIVNGEAVCYVSAFGFVAPVPYLTSNALKKALGHTAYILSALPVIAKKPEILPIRYTANGVTKEMNVCLGLISSTRGVGGITLYPRADMDNGKMDVFLVRDVTPDMVPLFLGKYLSNSLDLTELSRYAEVFSTDSLRIEFLGKYPEHEVDNDGNVASFTYKECGGVLDYMMGKKIKMLLPGPRQ